VARIARIHFNRQVAVPPEVVWEVLADHRGMTGWTPVRKAELEREGDPAPNGVGAIRVLHAVGPPIREEITVFEPPRLFEYKMLSGAPVRNYLGRVLLEPADAGTEVDWTVTLTPRLPAAHLVVRQVISSLISGLVKEAEQRVAAAPG
jgi:uncharacterized protein YndB with AHSA1/START domain